MRPAADWATLRGLVHVRAILGNIGSIMLPGQLTVSQTGSAFNAAGELIDEKKRESAETLTARSLIC